eukprot:2570303-Alexandrium_andersonii.AAC.1
MPPSCAGHGSRPVTHPYYFQGPSSPVQGGIPLAALPACSAEGPKGPCFAVQPMVAGRSSRPGPPLASALQ